MISAGHFVAGRKCSGIVFGGFSSFALQRGTLQFIRSLCITFWSICKLPSYNLRQQVHICVILKTFGHDRTFTKNKNRSLHESSLPRTYSTYRNSSSPNLSQQSSYLYTVGSKLLNPHHFGPHCIYREDSMCIYQS